MKTKWKWTYKEQVTFNKLKNILSSDKPLIPYNISKIVIIEYDACDQGVGAVLFVTFGEQRYATIDQQAMALVFAVKFRQYLSGRQFKVRTDHKPLKRIFKILFKTFPKW